jgi:nucleoside-diphosphate-sugar epimerase
MKKILVAGGSGYLGSYLINQINKKNYSISLSRSSSKNAKVDIKCNFLNKTSLKSSLKILKKKFTKIDCIIFTIGNSEKKIEDIKEKFRINFLTFRNFLNLYCKIFKFKSTKIIVISSIVTEKNFKDAPRGYTLGKIALKNYVRKQSKKLTSKKININLISPGNIFMTGNNWHQRLKKDKLKTMKYIKKNVPINNFIHPKIIFQTCNLIMQDNDNYYTGSNFIIDGGQSL